MAFVYSQQCCGGVCVSCLVVCAQEAKAKGFDVLILDTAGRLNVTAQPPRRIPYGTVIPCGTAYRPISASYIPAAELVAQLGPSGGSHQYLKQPSKNMPHSDLSHV